MNRTESHTHANGRSKVPRPLKRPRKARVLRSEKERVLRPEDERAEFYVEADRINSPELDIVEADLRSMPRTTTAPDARPEPFRKAQTSGKRLASWEMSGDAEAEHMDESGPTEGPGRFGRIIFEGQIFEGHPVTAGVFGRASAFAFRQGMPLIQLLLSPFVRVEVRGAGRRR